MSSLLLHSIICIDKDFKYPSIIYFRIGFVMYIVAILHYKTGSFAHSIDVCTDNDIK